MPRPAREIAASIVTFQPVDDEWLPLDALVQELADRPDAVQAADALLGIFERFPDHDGYGVFWTIIHALEAMPGYEHHLLPSVCRVPCEFNLTMLARRLNAKMTEIGGVKILDELARIVRLPGISPEAREQVQEVLDTYGG